MQKILTIYSESWKDSWEHNLSSMPYESETQNAIITYEYRKYWSPDKLKHVKKSLKWIMYTRQRSSPSTATQSYNKY